MLALRITFSESEPSVELPIYEYDNSNRVIEYIENEKLVSANVIWVCTYNYLLPDDFDMVSFVNRLTACDSFGIEIVSDEGTGVVLDRKQAIFNRYNIETFDQAKEEKYRHTISLYFAEKTSE